jgi:2-polyprenyl-3-methyl-5-hydroxy-6-metoxy-1,4-benzoquinol methylase
MQCPVCFSNKFQSISEKYYKCTVCSIILNNDHSNIPYDDNYFIDEYAEQYGKTYEEDFDNIYSIAGQRIKRVLDLSGKPATELSLLDIGCALGFFLKRGQDLGIKDLKGIEVSSYGASYCKENFNIPVLNISIDDIERLEKFDIISAWFVIEHLSDPLTVLNNLYNHLNDDGVLALSLPSYFGPAFHFKRAQWIEDHPIDHLIDVSPRSIKRLLKSIGFKDIRVFAAGFHPDRVVS